jgi:hypothetical protein
MDMRPLALRPARLALVLLLAGCAADRPGATEVVRADSAGVAIVVNAGPDVALDWRAREVLRIGEAGAGGEGHFRVRHGGVAVDGAGNIFVLDVGDFQLRVYDRDGALLRTHGRQGSGPGELAQPQALFVSAGGEAWIGDDGKRAFVRFGPDGATLDQVPYPPGFRPTAGASAIDERGGVIIGSDECVGGCRYAPHDPLRTRVMHFPGGASGQFGAPVELAVIDWAQPEHRPVGAPRCPIKIATPPTFHRWPVWRATPDAVLYNGAEEYVVGVAALDGGRLSIRRDLPVVRPTRQATETTMGPVDGGTMGPDCSATAAERASQAGWAERLPWVVDVARTPGGEILVRRHAPDAEGSPGMRVSTSDGRSLGTPPVRIDAFSGDGTYMGTLPPDFPFSAVWRAPDELVLVERDDLGRLYVVVHHVTRGSDRRAGADNRPLRGLSPHYNANIGVIRR